MHATRQVMHKALDGGIQFSWNARPRLRRPTITLALLALLGSLGCSETVAFRSTPPGAEIYVDNQAIGTTPVDYRTEPRPDLSRPRSFRVEYNGQVIREGTLTTRRSGGRITGAVFTAGILAALRSMRVFNTDVVDTVFFPTNDNPATQFFSERGSGKIKGQAFARTMGGSVVYSAGEVVGLHPDCPLVREYYRSASPNAAVTLPGGALTKTTIADGDGRFEFENLAAGRYIVVTNVNWYAYTGSTYVFTGNFGFGVDHVAAQGGPLIKEVTVDEGKTSKIVMAR